MSSKRTTFLLGFFVFSLGIIVLRLFYWQIVKGERLTVLAESQRLKKETIPGTRGKIFSSDGFPLVINQTLYHLYLNNNFVTPISLDKLNKLYQILNPADVDHKDFFAFKDKIDTGNKWLLLSRNLQKDQKEEIDKINIPNLVFEADQRREYPEGSMSAHLLGFLGKESLGGNKGYFGIEGYYNRELSGVAGFLQVEKDASGGTIPIGEKIEKKAQIGRNLILYLDRGIQYLAEDKLKKGLEKYGALSGSVLIVNPQNGGIIANASFPNYDPFYYYQYDQSLFPDPVISLVFEPGSIFKILVMAAGINEKIISPKDRCPICTGPKIIGQYAIRTWDDKYHPDSTMTEILINSDNVGMVYIAEKLGKEKLSRYLNNFGIGKPTKIDAEGEAYVNLRPVNQWADIDLATISFGQGVAVTPLEMIMAASSIANGGKLFKPRFVKEIDSNGKTILIEPEVVGQPISPSTAKVITEMMINTVQKGEAKWAVPKGYRIAGKTGTAQIPISGHYDKEKTIASFIGFAPADNPKFVMLVTLKEPSTSPWGSETAAPLWFDIAKDIFKIWGIPPNV